MIRVTEVEQTCLACPAQWAGMTNDGRHIYARFRGGRLSVRIGKPGDMHEFAAVRGEEVLRIQLSDGYDGFLSFEELREVTKDLIQWPEQAVTSEEGF